VGQSTTMGLLVEAGWAPWIQSGDVSINTAYSCDSTSTRFNSSIKDPDEADMVNNLMENRRHKGFWVPWVGDLDASKTNSRCSIGGLVFPMTEQLIGKPGVKNFDQLIRPVGHIELGIGKTTVLTILLVHAISSKKAIVELGSLLNIIYDLVQQDTPTLVVGDMNTDLQEKVPNIGNWRYLRCCHKTHRNGGELDYGLLLDPTGRFSQSTGTDIGPVDNAPNDSDHSVMEYYIA
jgi:hypothetical protein